MRAGIGFLCLFVLCVHNSKCVTTHVLMTAALIDKKYEERKQEYIYSLIILKNWGYEPCIVESCKQGPTFLNDYSSKVIYSATNNPLLHNKGANEVLSLCTALKEFNLDDNDMIVKLTGRYYFSDNSFLHCIQQHPAIDAFIKYDTQLDMMFTGCFALRAHFFKRMIESINIQEMEQHMINIELLAARYIKNLHEKGDIKVMFLDHLGVVANIFGEGICSLTHW